jgi:hypothetical protein
MEAEGFDEWLRPSRRSDWKEKNELIGPYYIKHRLMTTAFMINVELAAKAAGDLEFFDQLRVLNAKTTSYHSEAEGRRRWWNVAYEKDGKPETTRLEPDQMFALVRTVEGERDSHYFLFEADRATETQEVRIGDKLRRYRISAREQLVERHYGITRFNVLVVTLGEGRAENMVAVSKAVNKEVMGSDSGWPRFLFTTEGQINKTLEAGGTLIDAPWLNGRGDLVTLRQILYPEQAPEPELPGEVFSGR